MEDDDDDSSNHEDDRLDALDQFRVDILSLEDGPAARIVLYNVNLPR